MARTILAIRNPIEGVGELEDGDASSSPSEIIAQSKHHAAAIVAIPERLMTQGSISIPLTVTCLPRTVRIRLGCI